MIAHTKNRSYANGCLPSGTLARNIVFIGKRSVDHLMVEVAKRLVAEGHNVLWLQMTSLRPFWSRGLNVVTFKDTWSEGNQVLSNEILDKIRASDRSINFFGRDSASYEALEKFFSSHFERFKPDIVFGEAAHVVDLLALEVSRYFGIPYLYPVTARYPSDRFVFCPYDSALPINLESQAEKAVTEKYLRAITAGDALLSYMQPKNRAGRWTRTLAQLLDQLHALSFRFFKRAYGLTFVEAASARSKRKRAIARWQESATPWSELRANLQDKKTGMVLCYMTHMQPEATIDVWGADYRDQYQTVMRFAEVLHEGDFVLVKPNPKMNYDFSESHIEQMRIHPRVKLLPFGVPTDDLKRDVDVFVTVTGTVAYEGVFHGFPVICLAKTVASQFLPDFELVALTREKVAKFICLFRENWKAEHGELLLSDIWTRSTGGVISSPVHNEVAIEGQNIDRVADGFKKALAQMVSAHG